MRRAFFIVGPTATGKSELAASVACEIGAEIVSADAFQIYRGLNLLTAKPEASTLAKAPHHLIATTPLDEEMNVERYRVAAATAIAEIHSRDKPAIVVGGSGLYIKALTHGLAAVPQPDPKLRETLNAMTLDELRAQLDELDPEATKRIDVKNRRRVLRALEICLLTGKPVAASLCEVQRANVMAGQRSASQSEAASGVFVFRDREELYSRINQRVEAMFQKGVIEEVRAAGEVSATASQMIGFREIRQLLNGEMSPDRAKPGSSFSLKGGSGHEVQTEGAGRSSRFSEPAALWAQSGSIPQCIAAIQQATRRYAKRQLTWFRRQTNFSPLNLSLLTHNEAVNWVLLRMRSERRKVSGVRAKG
jgi:tRNA dimethylallyltransferase